MLTETKQAIVWKYFFTENDIADIAEERGLAFKSVLEVLRPYLEEAQRLR